MAKQHSRGGERPLLATEHVPFHHASLHTASPVTLA